MFDFKTKIPPSTQKSRKFKEKLKEDEEKLKDMEERTQQGRKGVGQNGFHFICRRRAEILSKENNDAEAI